VGIYYYLRLDVWGALYLLEAQGGAGAVAKLVPAWISYRVSCHALGSTWHRLVADRGKSSRSRGYNDPCKRVKRKCIGGGDGPGRFSDINTTDYLMVRFQRPHKRGNLEGAIQLQILHYCKARGFTIGKIKNKGSRIGNSFIKDPYAFLGIPDLLLFANGKMHFIEVKSPTGKQSSYQKSFQECCTASGISYILAKSLEDVKNSLDK
jgi:hypothetical protein